MATSSAAGASAISQEDLMRLTMKMKKRMEALETERGVTLGKNNSLNNERKELLELIKMAIPLPGVQDDQDLDLASISGAWRQWYELGQAQLETLSQDVARLHSQGATSSSSGAGAANTSDELQSLQSSLVETQSRLRRQETDCDRLRSSESVLKTQVTDMEKTLATKTASFDALKKETDGQRAGLEEKVLMAQMQVNSLKATIETQEKDFKACQKQLEVVSAQAKTMQNQIEEKDLALRSNKELVQALQARLVEIEPELERASAKLKEFTRTSSAQTLLKAEQEALLTSLRRDLKSALDNRDAATKQLSASEDFRGKYEIANNKVAALNEQISDLQAAADEKISTITRLRAEAQASERHHAMRTAMLATCEAQLESLRQELSVKDDTNKIAIERVSTLQTSLAAAEARLAERVVGATRRIEQLEGELRQQKAESSQLLAAQATQHEAALESAKREFNKKSGMARSMLSEKEEEVRVLQQRVADLQAEISSGAPAERRIFELARVQSLREATHSVHTDTREVAFQQLQQALSSKDLQLAQAQSSQSQLSAEVAELRRTVRREGVNMDYLKNIILQYMSFPIQAPERLSLVPVIAMLLQFSTTELQEAEKAIRDPVWAPRPPKEVKAKKVTVIGGGSSHGSSSNHGLLGYSPPPSPQAQGVAT